MHTTIYRTTRRTTVTRQDAPKPHINLIHAAKNTFRGQPRFEYENKSTLNHGDLVYVDGFIPRQIADLLNAILESKRGLTALDAPKRGRPRLSIVR